MPYTDMYVGKDEFFSNINLRYAGILGQAKLLYSAKKSLDGM